nr:hypothetical protein [Deltaproteobacteria bacterium]
AEKTQDLGANILSTYPTATMYREHIIRFLRYAMKISRLCRDKSLELKNESINPKDAELYTTHADKIDKQLVALRKNLNSIRWMVPPKPEKPEEPKKKIETEKVDENAKPEETAKKDGKTEDKKENTDK